MLLQVPSKKVQKPSPASQWKERTDQTKKKKKKTEMKTSPPQGLCGIDRWLSQSAPPLRPLNVVGARTPPGPPGRGQDSVFLSGAFPSCCPGHPIKGSPGEGARAPNPQGASRERGCSAVGTQLPRATAEETPPARRPAPTDLAELLALGELLEGIPLGTLGAGVQGRGRHPAPQSPPPPPPAPRRGPTGKSGAAARPRAPPPPPPPTSRPPGPGPEIPSPCGRRRLPPPPLPPQPAQ